jgi:hypothetical protein
MILRHTGQLEKQKARAEASEAERDKFNRRASNAIRMLESTEAKLAEAEDREAKLREALTDHNDLLRSAMQIAKREGVEGKIGSTNWDAYYNRVAVVLKRHHETANEARAALEENKP